MIATSSSCWTAAVVAVAVATAAATAAAAAAARERVQVLLAASMLPTVVVEAVEALEAVAARRGAGGVLCLRFTILVTTSAGRSCRCVCACGGAGVRPRWRAFVLNGTRYSRRVKTRRYSAIDEARRNQESSHNGQQPLCDEGLIPAVHCSNVTDLARPVPYKT